jgi:D-alanyl-D-alanine dipeptidase
MRFLRRGALALAAGLVAACSQPPRTAHLPAGCPPLARGTLVAVRSVDPSIREDVRYATPNNFTGAVLPGYETARALLRPNAAQALARVQRRLRADGLGLKVWDAYRPVRATAAMVAWAERTGNAWVLDQGYVARKSGHNLGVTVDLTLVRLPGGAELDMGTPFDTFSETAHPANATGPALANRMKLADAMRAEGWQPYDAEWWHFRLPGEYEALDVPIACVR